MVDFPVFLAVIFPLRLTDMTDGFDDFQVTFLEIFPFVEFCPPIIPGNVILQVMVNCLDFFNLMEERAFNFICLTLFLATSMVWTVLPFTLDCDCKLLWLMLKQLLPVSCRC